jgi:hypothetical protein
MISGRVAPLARFISSITSAFLLVPSAFGLLAGFFMRPTFFAGLAFLALRGLLVPGASAADVLVFSESMLMLISPLAALCGRHHGSLGFGEMANRIFSDWAIEANGRSE